MRDGQGRLRAMDMGKDFPDVYDGANRLQFGSF